MMQSTPDAAKETLKPGSSSVQWETGMPSTADVGSVEVASPGVQPSIAEPIGFTQLPSSGLLDLSRQQRNLLLLRPVFQLERDKMLGGDEAYRNAVQGIDTHYLALSALDLMMEATTVASGSTSSEILTHLAKVALRIKPELTTPHARRIGEAVLDALDNKANNHREFSFDYFDAPSMTTRAFRFRLVRFEPDLDDVYRYRPTEEGYLVYLGMLDLSPEDAQELMEKMLELLVQRGSFKAALDIAQRARKLSLEYRQLIRDRLYQAYRAPGSVNWSRDMTGRLDSARDHVRKRQAEDARMEDAVQGSLLEASDLQTRESLVALRDTLRGAGLIRMQLVTDINVAPELFIEAQRAVFRARRPTGLPDLEAQLLPQLLNLSATTLADQANNLISALYPPSMPRIYDLNSVFTLLLEQRSDDVVAEEDDGELEKFVPLPDQFPQALIQRANDWLTTMFARGATWRLDQLLEAAEDAGMNKTLRRCLVLILYRTFAPSESEYKTVSVRLTGETFQLDVAQGSNLEFTPKGEPDDFARA
jgi:hypothetical protein